MPSLNNQNIDIIKYLEETIRSIPDFPKPGIIFKDITTLLANPNAFQKLLHKMVEPFDANSVDVVVGMESRGFILGAPIAYMLNAGFVPVRKPGKLPADTFKAEYELEYGKDSLEIHQDAIQSGQRVLVVDDLLATGGTAEATLSLLNNFDIEIVASTFIIELSFLEGRKKLPSCQVHSLIKY